MQKEKRKITELSQYCTHKFTIICNVYLLLIRGYPKTGMISRLKEAEMILTSSHGIEAENMFIYTKSYPYFLVMDVLGNEVFRNVVLAILAVFICTEIILCKFHFLSRENNWEKIELSLP